MSSTKALQSEAVESVREWGIRTRHEYVSVVVPTWNRAAYIRDCLKGLFLQQYLASGMEIIVVNNGSTDDTIAAVDELGSETPCHLVLACLKQHGSVSHARNAGVALASGEIVAFTDDDCIPDPLWLARGVQHFQAAKVGIAHGNVYPPEGQRQPFFSHFIQITQNDGSFSTCNIFYRRQALLDAGGFDARCDYWEDVDLGWRTRRLGWESVYDPEVVVYHQIVKVSPWRWLMWPWKSYNWPAKAASYPEFRRHLFARLWIDRWHAVYTLFFLGLLSGALLNPWWLLLALPYVVLFPKQHGLNGKMPPVKLLLHLAWDTLSFMAAVAGSIRFRSPVL